MERLKSRWAILVSRVLVKYVEKLKGMKSFTVKHIRHIYSAEMKEKSEVVSKEFCYLFKILKTKRVINLNKVRSA